MKIIGIIAEYNPFHNGHAYQIEKIRSITNADYIVIAMSGDFVQRGAPAVINKYARTRMALSCGANLVIELPSLWACASAERFATAGCLLFEKAGCIDGLCFGAETADITLLSKAAELLSDEPEYFSKRLSEALKKGLSYPAAREEALLSILCRGSFSENAVKELLESPNNILAVEYLKAIKRLRLSLTPFPLKRNGADYHNSDIHAKNASATAIRTLLAREDSDFFTANRMSLSAASDLERSMPAAAFSVLKRYLSESPLLTEDDFSSILRYLLLCYSANPKGAKNPLSLFGDSNEAIANRIINNRHRFETFSQFCELNKSRDITYTRMSRILLHTVLNIKNDDYKCKESRDYIPYLRILGFRKDSIPLLKELKRTAKVPIISKSADASRILEKEALRLFERDIFAAELYEQTKYEKFLRLQKLTAGQKKPLQADSCVLKSEYAMEIAII